MNQTTVPQGKESLSEKIAQGPKLALQAIYSKNSSFELGNIKKVDTKAWSPEMRVEIDSHEQQLGQDLVEVVLTIRLTALQQGQTAYVVNHEQAGRFLLQEIPQDKLERILKGQCVQTLYPYAREVISNVILRSGFPPIYLQDVNFDASYLAQKNQRKDNAEAITSNKNDEKRVRETPLI